MKKYVLFFLALLLTAAVVTATVLNNKKTTKNASGKSDAKKECSAKKSHCPMSKAACY